MEFHTIEPIYDKNSKILILGSFPSVKSREANFFYGHPQNRFWKVLASMNDVSSKHDRGESIFDKNIILRFGDAHCKLRHRRFRPTAL